MTQIWANNSDLPFSSELELLKDFAPAPEGVAAAVSLFVSSTNYCEAPMLSMDDNLLGNLTGAIVTTS